MNKPDKKSSREAGLELGVIFGEYFLNLQDLHYGYWDAGLPLNIANLHRAQQNYTDFLLSHIPQSVHTVLDVGCGSGRIAARMIDAGYRVDCLCPSPFLDQRVRSLLGDNAPLFECPYEDMETQKRYDLILFAESFQYISLDRALHQTLRFLNDGGYLLICDSFKLQTAGKRVVGGGHKLKDFYEKIRPLPFQLVTDVDITEQTAPNLDLMDDVLKKVIAPALDTGLGFLRGRYPLATKLVTFKYRKKIRKMQDKYFGGGRTADEFKKCKSYRLLLYKKTLHRPAKYAADRY